MVSDVDSVRVLGVLPICVEDHTIFAQYWHQACFRSAAEKIVLSLIEGWFHTALFRSYVRPLFDLGDRIVAQS